jgi:HEAT repeat protein
MLNEINEKKSKRDVEGLFALLHSNRNKDSLLRLDAAEALAQLGDKRGLDYLNQMMNSSDKDIQEVASEILEGLKDYQPEPILQTQILKRPSANSWIYKTTSKYPYLVAWLAFIALYFLAGSLLTPAIDLLLLITESWLPEFLSYFTRLLLYIIAAFFVFRFVVKKIVLPHEGMN